MSGYLDTLQDRFVEASRELSRARRRRVRRRGAVCAALIVLVTPPALAATGVWRPQLGDGRTPAPEISADAPPPDQLAMLGVLRREQSEADRGVASRYALQFVGSGSITGVRTNRIRLLAQSNDDRGVVLVPVERYHRQPVPLPEDAPAAVREQINPPPVQDALCVFQLDVDGAGTSCWSTADVREGRAWMALGRRSFWLVPDGVAKVRAEYAGHDPIEAPARENAVIYSRPDERAFERRITFLDADGNPVRVIERPNGPGGPPPAVPAAGATRSGVVRSIGVQGKGLEAGYQVRIRLSLKPSTLELERPACAGRRRVSTTYGGGTGDVIAIITPDWGDQRLARWCPGVYRGLVRSKGARKLLGTFSFRVR